MSAIDREDLEGLLLIKHSLDADGGFLLAYILKLLLGIDGNHNVVLVAIRQTMTHYGAVMRKVGLNVANLAAAGRIVLVDALKPVDLGVLRKGIEDSVSKMAANGAPLCVIFDDLSTLLSSSNSNRNSIGNKQFVQALSSTISAAASCVITVVYSDIVEDERLITQLQHNSATVIELESLKTGRSAEVGGKVRIFRRTLRQKEENELGEQEYYFSVAADASVRFIESSVR